MLSVINRLQLSVNCWQHLVSMCQHEIILSSEVGEKLQRELHSCLKIFKYLNWLTNIFQLQGALSPRPEALVQVKTQPRTLKFVSKSHARNDCIDLPTEVSKLASKYLFIPHIKRICSNRNKLHCLTEQNSRLGHYFALFLVWVTFGLFSYFSYKILLSYSCSLTPMSYKGDKILRLSCTPL